MLHRSKFYSEWRVSLCLRFFFLHFSALCVLLSPLFLTFVHNRITLRSSLSGAVASTVYIYIYIFSATSFLFNKNSQHTRRYFVRFFFLFLFRFLPFFLQRVLCSCCCWEFWCCCYYYCYYLYFFSWILMCLGQTGYYTKYTLSIV